MFHEGGAAELAPAGERSGRAEAPHDLDRDRLLSSICHDLKAPLASMTMGVAFLRRVLPHNDDPTSRVVDALHRAAHRMSRTVASFSDLAKLQTGDLRLDAAMAPVGDIANSAFEAFQPEATADSLRLTLDVDPAVSNLRIPCDRARLAQALWHLFVCVRHVVPAPGSLAVRVRHDEAAGVVRFELDGALAAATSACHAGTELPAPDLTIARGLVALHGGNLDVSLRAEGVRVAFSLPTRPKSVPCSR